MQNVSDMPASQRPKVGSRRVILTTATETTTSRAESDMAVQRKRPTWTWKKAATATEPTMKASASTSTGVKAYHPSAASTSSARGRRALLASIMLAVGSSVAVERGTGQ